MTTNDPTLICRHCGQVFRGWSACEMAVHVMNPCEACR